MTIVDVALLAVALGALGGWAWWLNAASRAILPQAQALQALQTLHSREDEKIRKVFEKFENRPGSDANLAAQVEAIKRKASRQGYNVEPPAAPAGFDPPVGPAPDGFILDLPFIE